MTVQELIDRLQAIEDKDAHVVSKISFDNLGDISEIEIKDMYVRSTSVGNIYSEENLNPSYFPVKVVIL